MNPCWNVDVVVAPELTYVAETMLFVVVVLKADIEAVITCTGCVAMPVTPVPPSSIVKVPKAVADAPAVRTVISNIARNGMEVPDTAAAAVTAEKTNPSAVVPLTPMRIANVLVFPTVDVQVPCKMMRITVPATRRFA